MKPDHQHHLKQLVQCRRCARQYDTEGLSVGSRFHCSCGAVLVTESVAAHDSAVVRCSACGGVRNGLETSCGFCQADFTVHERDLVAICPGCATRLPRSARFCHGCGVAIDLSASKPGGPSDRICPRCGGESRLRSRRLGDVGATGPEGQASSRRLGTVLECPKCAGLWVAAEAFSEIELRAKRNSVVDESIGPRQAIPPLPGSAGGARGRIYRPCVTCGQLMQRRNYARRSGVVLDVCRDHGIWFDEKELESILEWVRRGGWEREERRRTTESETQERRERRRRAAARSSFPVSPVTTTASWLDGFWMLAVVAEIMESLFDL